MEEAIEICKLRLFLKLVAQIDNVKQIEPLPDIDFNIRAGNTLVGFATYDEVKKAVTGKDQMAMQFDDTMQRIEVQAEYINTLFESFHKQQTELGGEVAPEDKQALKEKLKALEDELNQYLAGEYGIDPNKKTAYEKWLKSHHPFHWFIEFYGILTRGGFDVIIGNPPYVEYSKVKKEYRVKEYETESCGNIYAFVIERSIVLLKNNCRTGMIVPFSAVSTVRMLPIVNTLHDKGKCWLSNYDERPSFLFSGVCLQMSIFLFEKYSKQLSSYITPLTHWSAIQRDSLFNGLLSYQLLPINGNNIPFKIGSSIETIIMDKIINQKKSLLNYLVNTSKYKLYYRTSGGRYFKLITSFAPYFTGESGAIKSSKQGVLYFITSADRDIFVSILNASFFYWFWRIRSNCRDLTMKEIENFPISLDNMSKSNKQELSELSANLMADLKSHAYRKECTYKATGKVVYDEFYPKKSKPIIDEIDHVLAKHYGFTDEELDFIINYDIKYRMGIDS